MEKQPTTDRFTTKIKYLKCRSFFPDYCGIKYTSGILRKLSGKNANGNPGSFNANQRMKMIEGVRKLLSDLEKSV